MLLFLSTRYSGSLTRMVMAASILRGVESLVSVSKMVIQEFMLATDMTSSGSTEEKLRWAFKMYDEDGSGDRK